MLKLGFIGAGIVGTALAVKLKSSHYQVISVFSKSHSSAQSFIEAVPRCKIANSIQEVANSTDLIFITTPDNAIFNIVSQTQWQPHQSVVHCSGADSTDILEHARSMGSYTGVFSPATNFCKFKPSLGKHIRLNIRY